MSKQYSLEDVQKHNTPDDAWIVIDNKVYNITQFAKLHPGGTKILTDVAGTDATKQFNYFHAQKVLEKYHAKLYKGDLATEDRKEQKGKPFKYPTDVNAYGEQVPYGDHNWMQGWKSPYYNESHRKYRNAVREYVKKNFMPFIHEWDEAYQIPKEVYIQAGDAGLLQGNAGAHWDVKYNGDKIIGGIKPEEFDVFHTSILVSELCRTGSAGFYWGLAAGLGIGLPPVLHFGSDYLKDKYARDCVFGRKFICLAITEPWAGSDVAGLQTVGKLSEDEKYYTVNGIKKWITNGIFSDYFTCAVRTGDKDSGMMGLSLFLIERNLPGVKCKKMKCQGMWASGTTYITLEDVKVPAENLIGNENQGFFYIMSNFNGERFALCSQAESLARVCFEEAFKFAHKRKTFGKLLIQHPVIRNKLAHMARMIEATHAQIERVAYNLQNMTEKERNRYLAGPICLLKAQSTQTVEYCAREAVQIFGGLGYTRGGQGEKVERIYREVRGLAIPGGSEEIMLDFGIRQAMRYMPAEAKL